VVEVVVEVVPVDDPPPPHALNVTEPTKTMDRRGNRTRDDNRKRCTRTEWLLGRTVSRMWGLPLRRANIVNTHKKVRNINVGVWTEHSYGPR
jgi:hypothetical protein